MANGWSKSQHRHAGKTVLTCSRQHCVECHPFICPTKYAQGLSACGKLVNSALFLHIRAAHDAGVLNSTCTEWVIVPL